MRLNGIKIMRGTTQPEAPKKSALKTKDKGRVCEALDCKTALSIYNPKNFCYHHAAGTSKSTSAYSVTRKD